METKIYVLKVTSGCYLVYDLNDEKRSIRIPEIIYDYHVENGVPILT